jgi:RNA polymerase primary sigma factor
VDPEAGTLAEAGGHVLRRVMQRLDARERRVIEMRYGMSDQPALTLKEVSVALGISREGARQIEVRALARLRHALHAAEWD